MQTLTVKKTQNHVRTFLYQVAFYLS